MRGRTSADKSARREPASTLAHTGAGGRAAAVPARALAGGRATATAGPDYFGRRLAGIPLSRPGDAAETRAEAIATKGVAGTSATPRPGPLSAGRLSDVLGHGEPLDGGGLALGRRMLGPIAHEVRVHTDSAADAAAQAMSALAMTDGRDIAFRRGAYAPDTAGGRIVLAHELGHVAAGGNGPRLQRWRDGRPDSPASVPRPVAPGALPSADQSAADPEAMSRYLASRPAEALLQEGELQGQPGDTPEQREAMRPNLERLVRLNALGMMSSHRASIEAARDRLRPRLADAGDARERSGELEAIREAAALARRLMAVKEEVEDYRDGMHQAHSATLHRRGDVGDVISQIIANGSVYMEEAQRAPLARSLDALMHNPTADRRWLFAYGASTFLERWRNEQILGIEAATSEVYTRFPLLAQMPPADIARDAGSSELLIAALAAYGRVLWRVDDAINAIATDDIHPFDMPEVVRATRVSLAGVQRQALDDALQDRQVTRFWLNMGLTLFETLVVFVPVVGPAIALGVAAAMVGTQLEDMLDRLTVARANVDPYSSVTGVVEPSAIEWVMTGVGALLTAFGGGVLARQAILRMRAPTPALLAEIGEPATTYIGDPNSPFARALNQTRPRERPYASPEPGRMESYRGRPVPLDSLPPERYLWVVEEDGTFTIAPENQPGLYPRRTDSMAKHGDLAPGPGGAQRGVARGGGELDVIVDANGQRRYILNNSSSFSAARIDPLTGAPIPPSTGANLDAVRRLLQRYGTDVNRLTTQNVIVP